MTELDFRQLAQRADGIEVIYYPPRTLNGTVILQTRQTVRLGEFVVSPGRWTDGGSIPGIAKAMANPFGHLFRAFLIHDTSLFDRYGWQKSNDRLRAAMKRLNAPLWQRTAIMAGVQSNAVWQRTKATIGLEADYVG